MAGIPAERYSEGTVYGVELGAYYNVSTLSSNVNISNATAAVGYQFNSGTQVGVNELGEIIDDGGITGSISIQNATNSVGILHSGTGDRNLKAQEPLVGHNKAQIRITSEESSPVQSAIGIFVNGEGEDNDILGELSGIFSGNIDIDVVYTNLIPSEFVNAAVSGIFIAQKEGYDSNIKHITFGDGATISAQFTVEGDSSGSVHLGDSVHLRTAQDNNRLNLTTQYDTDTVSLTGNIRAHYDYGEERITQDLSFQQGNYIVTAEVFEASSITLGSIDPLSKLMTDASITLTQSLELSEVTQLDFYVQSFIDNQYSTVSLLHDATLDISSVDHLNIYLGEDLMEYSQYTFDLISGDVAGLDEGVTVSIYDGTRTGDSALLWTFDMNGIKQSYSSTATVTEHYFEVTYSDQGVTLRADIPAGVPEPSVAALVTLIFMFMLQHRRRAIHQ